MRTIKFRAKDSNGNWHYGDLVHSSDGGWCRIHDYDENAGFYRWFSDIDPDTIGQFTGLCDKNGREIYEGDIIGCDRPNIRHLIFYCEKEARFKAALNGETEMSILGICGLDDRRWNATKEVIGNIHDNPELIEKGGNQ